MARCEGEGVNSYEHRSGLAVTREVFRRPRFTPSDVVAKQTGDLWIAFENDFVRESRSWHMGRLKGRE